MRLFVPLSIGVMLVASGAVYANDKSSKEEKYTIKTIGEPKSCVRRSNIRSTNVLDDWTIDFKMRNGDTFRNKLPNRCSGLGFEEAFSYRTSINRLCNVDIIRVLDTTAGRVQTRGVCGLGKFQQISKTKKPAN